MSERELGIREAWEKNAKHFDFSRMPVWRAPFPTIVSPTPHCGDETRQVADVLEFKHERHYSEDGRLVRDRIVCEGVVLDEHICERSNP